MNKIIIAITSILAITAFVISTIQYFTSPKTAYVSTAELYNEFNLKKELEGRYLREQGQRNKELDSIKLQVQNRYTELLNQKSPDKAQIQKFEALESWYYQKEEEIKEEDGRQAQDYTEQVWKQLNQYIKEYGDKESYTYLYGARGEGNLLYAKDSKNVTKELIEFVNARYEGDL